MLNLLSFRRYRGTLVRHGVHHVEDPARNQDRAQRQPGYPEPGQTPLSRAWQAGRPLRAVIDPDVVGDGLASDVGLPPDRAALLRPDRPRQIELVEEETI